MICLAVKEELNYARNAAKKNRSGTDSGVNKSNTISFSSK